MTPVSLHISLWLRLCLFPCVLPPNLRVTEVHGEAKCRHASPRGWPCIPVADGNSPSRAGPRLVWVIPECATSKRRPALDVQLVSARSFLVGRTSRAMLGSLTTVKLDGFAAAAAGRGVLGTGCGSPGQ